MKRPALEAAGRLRALRRRAATGGGQGVTRWQHTPAARVAGGGLAARVIALQRGLRNQRVMGLLRSPKAEAVGPVAGPQATIQRQGGGVVNLTLGPVRHRTYELSATTLEEALNELSARGEWGSGGAENIQYEYSTNSSGIATPVLITAVLFTELPVWSARASQPRAVREEWDRMLAALRAHENHHVEIARSRLDAMRTALRGLPAGDFAAAWGEQLAALREAQDAYDDATDHGQNEGVSLDLSVVPEETEEE